MTRNNSLLRLISVLAYFVSITVGREAIIGGKLARANQFPYQALLSSRIHECGAGIVDDHFLLTAAHCVIKPNHDPHSRNLSIIAGVKDQKHPTHQPVTIRVDKIFVLKSYNPKNMFSAGDIAVIKLRESLELSKNHHLKKLDLPKSKNDSVDVTAIIAGYGFTWFQKYGKSEYGGSDGRLRYAETNVYSRVRCASHFHGVTITDNHLCGQNIPIYKSQPYSTCSGDSGSPLVHDGKTVIGILSLSPENCKEENSPSIYTRIAHYLDFIHHAINGQDDKDHTHVIQLPR